MNGRTPVYLQYYLYIYACSFSHFVNNSAKHQVPGGGGLPYMGFIGICRCEGYGFQAVYSRVGYINQSAWV